MAVDKAVLLAASLPTDTVDIPAGTVTVRGLSRAEVVRLQRSATPDDLDIATLAAGMVDPALTAEEAGAWRAVADNDTIRLVSDRILELSGLTEGDQTAKERSFRPGNG